MKIAGKRADLQIKETILVLFICFIVIAMVLVVVYRYMNKSIENAKEDLINNEIFSLLISLPDELSYSYLGDDYNAIDTSRLFELNLSYLGYKRILIEQAYPQANNYTCTISNYPNCGKFIVYNKESRYNQNKIVKYVPVSLYYPISKEFRTGRLIVEYYY